MAKDLAHIETLTRILQAKKHTVSRLIEHDIPALYRAIAVLEET